MIQPFKSDNFLSLIEQMNNFEKNNKVFASQIYSSEHYWYAAVYFNPQSGEKLAYRNQEGSLNGNKDKGFYNSDNQASPSLTPLDTQTSQGKTSLDKPKVALTTSFPPVKNTLASSKQVAYIQELADSLNETLKLSSDLNGKEASLMIKELKAKRYKK